MLKKGLAVAVILLFIGVAFAPTINANVSKSSLEPIVDVDVIEEDVATATPIQLVFQLIAKLRNHKDIQNIESEDDVLKIIEGDDELNSIVENLKSFDCGCDDATPTRWNFPVLCLLLVPLWILAFGIFVRSGEFTLFFIVSTIGSILNCFWPH